MMRQRLSTKHPGNRSASVKRSVTLAADVDARAHDLVGERGFSAFVNEALDAALQLLETRRLISEFEATHGEITQDELNRAKRIIARARKTR